MTDLNEAMDPGQQAQARIAELEAENAAKDARIAEQAEQIRRTSWMGEGYATLEHERDQLRAENERLRDALKKIAEGNGIYGIQAGEYKGIARAALQRKAEE